LDPNVNALPSQSLHSSLFCPLEGVREHEMKRLPLKGIGRVLVWLGERNFPDPSSPVAALPQPQPELTEVWSRQKAWKALAGLGS
jgi:hypothetical protein